MRIVLGSLICLITSAVCAQINLQYEQNKTVTYDEALGSYMYLDSEYKEAKLIRFGPTDSGRDLHLFVMSNTNLDVTTLDFNKLGKDKTIILVNNGIHAGESCGIDASILFAEDMLKKGVPENVLIGIIPAYSTGGVLNRSCCSRINQNGPEMHGFRGNARNLDLNRDFIKADARNTMSFYTIFHMLKPHIFVDTHTSNGADYQYTITLISTQKDKLNPVLGGYLEKEVEPQLYNDMKKEGWDLIPYVFVFGNNTPDKGYQAFLETPRYASGYTTLFNTLGFITETHMLKPYKDRVESTRAFLKVISHYANNNSESIRQKKREADMHDQQINKLDVSWRLNREKSRKIKFKGYEYEFVKSELSGHQRLKYYRDKPKTFEIDYYPNYEPVKTVEVPDYYVVPDAWNKVGDLLQMNNVNFTVMMQDTVMEVETTYITDYSFPNRPYEGHFPLNLKGTKTKIERRFFLKGDLLVPTDQLNKRFIVSVLEAEAVDSYLKWNFYDEIFGQKEGYSTYVFEDTALELLESDKKLKKKFENWKKENSELASQPGKQLDFIYRNSQMFEKEHLRYPVARIFKKK